MEASAENNTNPDQNDLTASVVGVTEPNDPRAQDRKHPKTIPITIDGEPYTVEDRAQTPNELMALAVPNPAEHYLVQIKNKKRDSFQERGDEEIRLHKDDVFVTVFTGATTVSELPPQFGVAHFQAGLEGLGYEVTDHGAGNLSFSYEVEVGPMQGRVVTLGFKVPDDFPVTPPSGPLVMPHIHPLQAGGVHPTGGVHLGSGFSGLGDSFQYWSRPISSWATSRKTVAEYMAFIRHLWATQ